MKLDKKLDNGTIGEILSDIKEIKDNISSGLLYTHTRINDNTKKALETTSFLYALIEILEDKGIISINELDEKKRIIAERIVQKFTQSGIGLMYQDPEYDKYTFEHATIVDCQSSLETCKALCCKLPFALSRQDVDEGIIHWEFGRPYLIAHGNDGYCVHLDRKTNLCTVHKHRPLPCRCFDCKDNEKWKLWLDFDKRIINHDLYKHISEVNGKFYTYPR